MQYKRVIFLRMGAIGDIIHSLPSIRLYKEMNPKSVVEILVASAQVKELLDQSCDFLDQVHLIRHKNFFDKPAQIFPKLSDEEKKLKESFIERPADEFIYLHSNKLKAYLLNQRVFKAKKIFVYKRDESLSAVANFVTTRFADLKEDLIENPFHVLKHKSLVLNKVKANRPYICVVLGVGALRPHRALPLARWIEKVENLLESSDCDIKILGGPDEKQLSKEFEEAIVKRQKVLKIPDYSRVENLIGKTSLLELAHILNSSEHLYSCDTGILHIAAALALPLTSIFSITSEKRFAPFLPEAKILRSSSCLCDCSKTNLPKFCKYPVEGYAKCMWGLPT